MILSTDHGGGSWGHGAARERFDYTIPLFLWHSGTRVVTDLYTLFDNRKDPGTNRVDYVSPDQPLRNGDGGNLALTLLGLQPVPGSLMRPQLAVPRFRLSIERTAETVTVSWPASVDEYALEAADMCLPNSGWQAITEGITVLNNRKVYSARTSAATRFFRLRK